MESISYTLDNFPKAATLVTWLCKLFLTQFYNRIKKHRLLVMIKVLENFKQTRSHRISVKALAMNIRSLMAKKLQPLNGQDHLKNIWWERNGSHLDLGQLIVLQQWRDKELEVSQLFFFRDPHKHKYKEGLKVKQLHTYLIRSTGWWQLLWFSDC